MRQSLEYYIFLYSLITALLTSILLIIINLEYTLGMILGGLMGSLIFRLLTLDAYGLLKNPSSQIKKRVRINYFKRYVLYAITLSIGIINPFISFGTTFIGLLIPKILAVILGLKSRRKLT